jgi:hypothetical protein
MIIGDFRLQIADSQIADLGLTIDIADCRLALMTADC